MSYLISNPQHLNVSHNHIVHINGDCLQPLSNLQQLDISYNGLKSLPEELFRLKSQLRIIDIARNQIVKLEPNFLMPLINLNQLKLAGNQLEDASWLHHVAPALNHMALRVDLSSNYIKSLNLSSLVSFEHVYLADNLWDCAWLIKNMLRTPPAALSFNRSWPMLSSYTDDLLNIRGIDCFDGQRNRSIVLLDVDADRKQQVQSCNCEVSQRFCDLSAIPCFNVLIIGKW